MYVDRWVYFVLPVKLRFIYYPGLYKKREDAVVVIGITVAIVIVVIGAGVNFAVWKRYHSKCFWIDKKYFIVF